MRTPATIARRVTAGLIAVLATAACGAEGANPQAGGDVVDGQNNNAKTDSPGSAAFPVTAEYAGLTWSITKVENGSGDHVDDGLLADLRVTNNNPIGMKWDARVATLKTSDGETVKPAGVSGDWNWEVEIGDGETTEATLEFDDTPDVDGLSLVIGEQNRIPEIVPFAGGAEAKPYPIDGDFSGSAKLRRLHDTNIGDEYSDYTVTADKAVVVIDALGKRAPVDGRLVVLDLRLGVSSDSWDEWGMIQVEEALRLDVDGSPASPIRFHETSENGYVDRGSSEKVTAVFEAPADAEELELIVTTNEGSERIPVEFDAFPPCCGE